MSTAQCILQYPSLFNTSLVSSFISESMAHGEEVKGVTPTQDCVDVRHPSNILLCEGSQQVAALPVSIVGKLCTFKKSQFVTAYYVRLNCVHCKLCSTLQCYSKAVKVWCVSWRWYASHCIVVRACHFQKIDNTLSDCKLLIIWNKMLPVPEILEKLPDSRCCPQ